MSAQLVVLITGAPGAGKTTLGKRLGADLDLPVLSRDVIKELLFDSLGWSNRTWSQRLGAASYPLLYHAFERLLQAHASCIVESNFDRALASPRLRALQAAYGFQVFQIVCSAPADERLLRMLWRIRTRTRHPGHAEYRAFLSPRPAIRLVSYSVLRIKGALSGRPPAPERWQVDLDGPVVSLDTTQLDAAAYQDLCNTLRAKLGDRG